MSSFVYEYMPILKIFIDSDDDLLKEMYQKQVAKFNEKVNYFESEPCDSGFDLFVPEETVFGSNDLFKSKKIDCKIKTEMIIFDGELNRYISYPYYLYPRSSISKTPLMLANHVGIVDSGYRGNVIAAVRCLYLEDGNTNSYIVEKYSRLFQICLPSLEPFYIQIVDDISNLSSTERGTGGFGSTGIIGVSI
jgi:dUTP pyrophosphatase